MSGADLMAVAIAQVKESSHAVPRGQPPGRPMESEAMPMVEAAPPPPAARHSARTRVLLLHLRPSRQRSMAPAPAPAAAAAAAPTDNNTAGGDLGMLLERFQAELGGRVDLSLVPSTPAAPLVAGHTLFHPADVSKWVARWSEARPGDGDPLRMLMAPAGEAFKRAPLIIAPAPGAPRDPASLSAWCDEHRQTLAAATDACGALLFRGWELEEVGDYEACMAGLGVKTSDFVGTAPRAKLGKYVVQNVSFESPKAAPAEPLPMDQLRASAGVVWAEDNMQFFNFHNELAYMDASHHQALGFANYAFFCCVQPSEVGGYTLVADARCAQPPFLAPFVYFKRSTCQDRLGTNNSNRNS